MFGFKDDDERKKTIKEIVDIEWEMFQKVNNFGGRASCQDDRDTFDIMRYSQYEAWSDLMIKSYRKDLEEGINNGRNLVMEKYAFMMEFSEPQYYKTQLEPFLPVIDSETMNYIEEITWYMVDCEKEIAMKYPKLSGSGRPIDAKSELNGFTSVETYAKGELKTYSKETLKFYLEHIRAARAAGKNLALIVQEAMVKLYGYESIEDAESKL